MSIDPLLVIAIFIAEMIFKLVPDATGYLKLANGPRRRNPAEHTVGRDVLADAELATGFQARRGFLGKVDEPSPLGRR